jgi:hypothetical protein
VSVLLTITQVKIPSVQLHWLPCSPPFNPLHQSYWLTPSYWDICSTHILPYINSILGLQGFFWIPEPWRWDREVIPKCWYEMTTTHCLIAQMSAVLSYVAAKAWNHVHDSHYTKCYSYKHIVTCHSSVNPGTAYGLGDSVQFWAEAWLSFVHHIQPVSFLGLKLTFSNMLTRVGAALPCSTWRWRQIQPQSFISFFGLWQFQNFSHSYDTSIKFYENLVRSNQAVTWRETDGQ